MASSASTGSDAAIENALPSGAASLESILCTEELRRRPSRAPDHQRENRALVTLVRALVDSPRTILQTLADTILDVTQCDSAGLSLLTSDGKTPDARGKRFYWPAIAGMWSPHVGGGTPRDFGPCGDVLDQNRTLLFKRFERRYPYLLQVSPAADECLLVPFYVARRAAGTIWAITHSERRKFDGEDERIMNSLAQFASSAYQAMVSLEDLRFQVAERERAETAVRELATGLGMQVRVRTQELERRTQELLATNRELEKEIVERKRAEEGLRRSEAFLVEAQRLSQTGSASWRVATNDITCSDELFRIFELDPPVTLERIRSRVHPEDLSQVEKMVEQARNHDLEWQCRVIMPDHSIKYLHAVAHAIRDQDGQLEYIAAVRDVTAQRLSDEALDEARGELAHVNRVMSLGTLAAAIAHELNQPLSGIVTNASTCLRMLAADPPSIDGARETARRMIRDGSRASDVIARLRALFGKKEPTIESIDLNEATREVIALLSSNLARNRVILQQQLADDLPHVDGDRVQLQQVILNLLLNASDAMSGILDRPRQMIITIARDEHERVRVAVRDVGVGFDPRSVDKLFEAFYTTKSGGMGIGLSVSRSIIERHHGRLWAELNDGPGATFAFSIPASSATNGHAH